MTSTVTQQDAKEELKREHRRSISIANEIFEALEYRLMLSMSEKKWEDLDGSEFAELMDYGEDMARVVAIENLGIGKNADCFAIADVLLRAIDRQCSEPESSKARVADS
jgi:hypothetical protein